MKTIRPKELIKRTAFQAGYFDYEVEDVINALHVVMHDALLEGDEIQFNKLFTVSAPNSKKRQYWDQKSYTMKTSRGVRKFRSRASDYFRREIEKHSISENNESEVSTEVRTEVDAEGSIEEGED